MYMVVANLLQKRKTYISVAKGGYRSLLEYLTDVGIDLSEWIVGSDRPQGTESMIINNNGCFPFPVVEQSRVICTHLANMRIYLVLCEIQSTPANPDSAVSGWFYLVPSVSISS